MSEPVQGGDGNGAGAGGKGLGRILTSPAMWLFLVAIVGSFFIGRNIKPTWTVEKVSLDIKTDEQGNEITPSHKNARYTVSLRALSNTDENLDNPDGVPVGGIIYGGRDSDTCVPIEQAFDWNEGIIAKGASIESETTSAT